MPTSRQDEGTPGPAPPTGTPIDTDLAAGFTFSCRPDCGLCCYASPSLREGEVGALLAILPSFTTDRDHPDQIPSRPGGGACSMLVRNRCSVHSARPGPCAEFPLSSHLSDRIQLSVVLSCPGLRLDVLRRPTVSRDGAAPRIDVSLSSELDAVRRAVARLTDSELRQASRSWERALATRGVDRESLARVRARLRTDPPVPSGDDLAAVPLPAENEGLDRLPLFFDPRYGRIALAADEDRVQLLLLRESGGVERRLASFPYPDRVPRLASDGASLLRAYLGYWAGRDAFVGAELDRMEAPGEDAFLDQATEDLSEIGASVVSRAIYRTWLDGGSAEELDDAAIERGIRATDADYLDRPTLGRWV